MYKSKYYDEKNAKKSSSITSAGIAIALVLIGIVALFMGLMAAGNYCADKVRVDRCKHALYMKGYRVESASYAGQTGDKARSYRNSDVYLFKVTNLVSPDGAHYTTADVKVEFCDVGDQNHVYDDLYYAPGFDPPSN